MSLPDPKPAVLVLARDGLFRESLEFVIGVEGCKVIVSGDWRRATAGDFDCLVIDEHVLGKDFDGAGYLAGLGRQVILLSSRTLPVPALPNARRVSKPLRGSSLVDEIRSALTDCASRLRRNP